MVKSWPQYLLDVCIMVRGFIPGVPSTLRVGLACGPQEDTWSNRSCSLNPPGKGCQAQEWHQSCAGAMSCQGYEGSASRQQSERLLRSETTVDSGCADNAQVRRAWCCGHFCSLQAQGGENSRGLPPLLFLFFFFSGGA